MDALSLIPFLKTGIRCLGLVLLPFLLNGQVYINASDNLPNDGASGQTVDVASVDIDLDGDKDIILANEYQVNSILYNNGLGFFQYSPNTLSATIHDSEDIAIADFDLDGDLDILFVSEDDFEHEFFLNDGAGNFDITPFYPFSASNSVVVDDFNDDGYPDLFIGNLGQNFILINNGDATFENETLDRLPWIEDQTYDVKVADVNNDGKKDILVGNSNGSRILLNQGGGYFEDETTSRFPAQGLIDTRKIVLGDIDNDGFKDIFLCNVEFLAGNDPQNLIYKNDGNGYFTDVTNSNFPAFGDQTLDGVFMDFDDDGDQDILITNVLHSPLLIYQNDGTGHYNNANNLALGGIEFTLEGYGIVTDDFNNDGLSDIYICNQLGKDLLLLRDPAITITAIKEVNKYIGKLWPNPIQNSFSLEKVTNLTNPSFKIRDLKGTEIINLDNYSENNNTYTFDLDHSSIENGIYFLEIHSDTELLTKEILILR